jgi:hypothetical protein
MTASEDTAEWDSVCESVTALQLTVMTICKSQKIPIISPNLVSTHYHVRVLSFEIPVSSPSYSSTLHNGAIKTEMPHLTTSHTDATSGYNLQITSICRDRLTDSACEGSRLPLPLVDIVKCRVVPCCSGASLICWICHGATTLVLVSIPSLIPERSDFLHCFPRKVYGGLQCFTSHSCQP